MTEKLPDPRLTVPPFVPRSHFACRCRDDLTDRLRAECRRLNCSQGVFLEVVLEKAFRLGLVTHEDVFEYSAEDRWALEKLAAKGVIGRRPRD